MDAAFRWPSRRVLSLLVLVCFTFFFSSHHSDYHSFVLHSRRDSLQARQGPATSFSGFGFGFPPAIPTTSSGSSVGPIGSSSTPEPLSSSSISTSTSSSTPLSQSTTESASSRSSTRLLPSTTLLSTSSTVTPPIPVTTDKPASSIPFDRPATTLSAINNFIPTLAQTSSEPLSSQTNTSTVGAASSHAGFWQNKGAVAATFVVVSLVVAALGAVAIMSYLKRRSKRYQERLHDELFENYTETDLRSSINNAPMDAFASRVESDDSLPFQIYGASETPPAFHPSSPVQHPDYYNTQSAPARYLSPSQALVSKSAAPPSSFHQPNNRDSYQPSIDSFYGADRSGRRT